MYITYAIIGFIAGIFIAASGSHGMLAAITGAVIGIGFARLTRLDRQVRKLESSVASSQRDIIRAGKPGPDTDTSPAREAEASNPWFDNETPHSSTGSPGKHIVEETGQSTGTLKPELRAADQRGPELAQTGPSILQTAFEKASAWITTGNVPVKVGVIVSFIGVAFLLKYAFDRQLLVIALEFRLLAVAAAGIALLVIGWRLREKQRVYALSLQGGGIGILYLTIFAALQLWQLLSAPVAFFLLLALTFFAAALAVIQNSRSLAILGVIGGFLAPILASTGQGSHVVLFSYYLVLNAAVLGIAWFRAWRGLNLVGWVFTFLVGSIWGYQYYRPDLFASTQPFLVLYFLFYQAIAVLFALRQPPKRLAYVDGTLVFGTPVIVFALQAALLEGSEYGLALSAALVAIFYALTATWLWRSQGGALRLLSESFVALGVVFATITIPLALDARWTSASWAVEGAALIWVAARQHRQLAKLAGIALIFLSGAAFFEHGWNSGSGWPLLNGNVLGGLLISVSALFASRKLELIDNPALAAAQKLTSAMLFAWGALWWFGTGWMEINDRVSSTTQTLFNNQTHVLLLFLTLSMGVGAWLGRNHDWSKMRRLTLLFLPLLVALALAYDWDFEHLLTGAGWLYWPLALAVQVFVLKTMDEYEEKSAAAWHFGSLLLLSGLLAFEVSWWAGLVASKAWADAAAVTITGVMALLVWRYYKRPAWPIPVHPETYLGGSLYLVAFQVAALAVLAIKRPGDPDPLVYIPLFNPFDLAMVFAMLTTSKSLAAILEHTAIIKSGYLKRFLSPYKLMLSVAFFIMTTFALVRGVHHYTSVAWHPDALFDSVIVQTALSIYWGLLGFSGMLWGARSSRRNVWLTGAGFMALVVVKLFAVDLGNTGSVERIISFIGIGALLLVVGYFAPAPPRAKHGPGGEKGAKIDSGPEPE